MFKLESKVFTQEEVFQHYFPESIQLGKKYKNPLRKDNKPGCNFYYPKSGNLQFIDKKINKFYNCFQFAMEFANLGSIKEVYSQMHNNNSSVKSVTLKLNENLNKISVVIKPFSEKELKFFGYSEKELLEHNVFQVKHIYYNDELTYADCKMTFAFVNYTTTRKREIQLYFPLKEKDKRYRSCSVNHLPQIEKLNYDEDYVIITKSNKEALRIQIQGFNGFAILNEYVMLSPLIVNTLHNKFNYIILNFDNDSAGRKLAIRYTKEYPDVKFLFMFLPFKLGKDLTELSKEDSENFVNYFLKKHKIK